MAEEAVAKTSIEPARCVGIAERLLDGAASSS
jgi:hypothetical protein